MIVRWSRQVGHEADMTTPRAPLMREHGAGRSEVIGLVSLTLSAVTPNLIWGRGVCWVVATGAVRLHRWYFSGGWSVGSKVYVCVI
jgi:hypothetical protein